MRRHVLLLALCVAVPATLPATGPAAAGAGHTIEDDIVIESSDGTPIVATLMLPDGASASTPVPAVIGTHG